jgi:hypothetical protein
MEAFNHGFNTVLGVVDIPGAYGFTKCLSEIMAYIKAETQGDPTKRFIDAVPLIEKIEATNKELTELGKGHKVGGG